MPVICTKNKAICFETITRRVLDKRRADIKASIQTLETFAVKNTDTPTNSKFIIGSSIPNSIVRRTMNRSDSSDYTISNSEEMRVSESVINKTEFPKSDSVELINQEETSKDDVKHYQNPSSIVAGSEKLQELQELHRQLRKSYDPKPLFTPRRPTLESIKTAIEKAKQENERKKNVGTDYKSVVAVNNASTSTEKNTKIKHKKKAPKDVQAYSSNSSATTSEVKTRNSKKISVDVKLKGKINKTPEKTE